MAYTCWPCLGLLLLFIGFTLQESLEEREEIKNKWENRHLDMCLRSSSPSFSALPHKMSCYRHRLHLEFVDSELYSERPIVMRIRSFLGNATLDMITKAIRATPKATWFNHNDPAAVPLFKRIQRVLRVNPEIAEDFTILRYGLFGSAYLHYDYVSPTGPYQAERPLAALGNRLATALLIVKPASKGGGTLFPDLGTLILPEAGDLILWFNADSNEVREDLAVHAGCPVETGEKLALSLWFRRNFQDGLKCSTLHAGYDPLDVLKRGDKTDNDYFMFDVNR